MSPKFNVKRTVGERLKDRPDATQNYEGGLAFKANPKTELALRCMTFLVNEPKFYTSGEKDTGEIADLIKQVAAEDPEFPLKLAAYVRDEMYLRSAPIFALVESAQYDHCKPFIEKWVPSIVRRADELTEVIAAFINKHGEIGSRGKASLPNSLKRGVAKAFYNFDRYQFAKYDRDGEVKLKDVLRLTHPKPRNEFESETFRMIRDRSLPVPVTWEVILSTRKNPETGETYETKKEAWEAVIPQMGYMAKLRNLRNFQKEGVDLTPALDHLTNPNAVKYSKQFPFRFFSAWKATTSYTFGQPRTGPYGRGSRDPFVQNEVSKALETAMELSVGNLPKLGGRTFITSDNSGSMTSSISGRSTVSCNEVANVMASIAHSLGDNAIASVFGTRFALVPLNPKDGILTNVRKLIDTYVDYSTNAWLALNYLNDNKIDVDRIFLFSDMQCYSTHGRLMYFGGSNRGRQSLAEEFKTYKRTVNPNVILYSWDLTGYGTLQFPEDEPGVVLMAGWSDRALRFIYEYEKFDGSMVGAVEAYEPKFIPLPKEG